jgi:hypothetical protein
MSVARESKRRLGAFFSAPSVPTPLKSESRYFEALAAFFSDFFAFFSFAESFGLFVFSCRLFWSLLGMTSSP